MLTIAIQPDRVIQPNGVRQSYSNRWMELASNAGVATRVVDAYAPDFFDQLAGCDGFMWRFGFRAPERLMAKRLLTAVEHGLGIPVFPSWKSAWHFEDKISQHYLLQAAGIPMPRTWVFWHKDAALAFLRDTSYPKVIKLANGFLSGNVRLVKSADEGAYWVDRLFSTGVWSFGPLAQGSWLRRRLRKAANVGRTLAGTHSLGDELQRGYFYVQEFVPGNEFDTRVVVIGNRAFAYRRMNRPGDFRASGSGNLDRDPAAIDLQLVRLTFVIAQRLGTQSVAIDALRRGEQRLVEEVSYTHVSWVVRDCPGHWVLHGEPETGDLEWVAGQMAPDDAIFEDFVAALRHRDVGGLLGTA
jgi:glutathione synthase/RimK-type ligase-like ATP-grasp enzyme